MHLKEHVTFYLVTDTNSTPKRFSVSRRAVLGACGGVVILFVCMMGLVSQYIQIRGAQERAQALEVQTIIQEEEITRQNEQIKKFAAEINSLKRSLVCLREFESKIRTLTDAGKVEQATGLLGMGGPMPQDLNPAIPTSTDRQELIQEMSGQVKDLDKASTTQRRSFSSLMRHLEEKKALLACMPSLLPVETGWITSGYGQRKSPFNGESEFHKGLDIAAPSGTPIIAPADGEVIYVGTRPELGNMMIVDHGHGYVTQYGHISKILRREGESVKRGEPIALVGSTGRSTGSHVHYEVYLNGNLKDPERYILN